MNDRPRGEIQPYSEAWFAQEMVGRYVYDIRYCTDRGQWVRWIHDRWCVASSHDMMDLARTTIRDMSTRAEHIDDEKVRGFFLRRLAAASRAGTWRAMLDAAACDERIAIRGERLDEDPWVLGCENGVVDLRTGELRSHGRDFYITKRVAAKYDADAQSATWDRFLDVTTKGDTDVQSFLARAVGYTLTGSTREEKLFFIHGPAASGKTTFTEAVRTLLGDYATKANFQTFLKSKGGDAPERHLARLVGARLVLSSEMERGKRLAEALVKEVVGGEKITARELYHEAFEYHPQFKLWLVANDVPWVSSSDSGLWRRILRIPFDHVVPPGERDPGLKLALTTDHGCRQAILAWAVRGCLAWQREGLAPPAAVEHSTAAYRRQMDPLDAFLSECCVFDELAVTPVATMWLAYTKYMDTSGTRRPLAKQTFISILRERGVAQEFGRYNGKSARLWRGVRLTNEIEAMAHGATAYASMDDVSDVDTRRSA